MTSAVKGCRMSREEFEELLGKGVSVADACPKCNSNSSVKQTRKSGILFRRRHCLKCDERWNTYEIEEGVFLKTVGRLKRIEDSMYGMKSPLMELLGFLLEEEWEEK